MPDQEDAPRAEIIGMIRHAGLRLTAEDEEELALLVRRFGVDQSLIASIDLGETEPAVVFVPPTNDGTAP